MTSAPSKEKAKFTSGNTMRHVVVMTTTSSVGLVSVFFVDALNLFYISMLGQQELAAAIGYASTLLFFSIGISLGISIAASAMVAKALGAEDIDRARSLTASCLIYLTIASLCLVMFLLPARFWLLALLGAEGETLTKAAHFLLIVIPSIPLLSLGMCLGALLRSKGDARRSMFVTLGGAIAVFILDPIFIFALDLGLTGAAIATVLSRFVLVIIGLHGVHVVHRMIGKPRADIVWKQLAPFLKIALPSLATTLATPVGNAYVTAAMAEFGDDAVAGWAIVGRLIPVAFGVVFALSGAIGPILAQNYGAKSYERVMQGMRDALLFGIVFCCVVWLLLALARNQIVWLFGAEDAAADMIVVFCLFVAGSFIFAGAMFISNAAFNNLGRPIYATIFNWGRATLGTFPFVYWGKAWGAEGVLIGWGLGAIVFGVLSTIAALAMIKRLPNRSEKSKGEPQSSAPPTTHSPFTTGKGAT